MSKAVLSAVGLLGVAAGALGAWVARPPHESNVDAASEQLVVLRDIQRDLQAMSESISTAPPPATRAQELAVAPATEQHVQALVSDLEQALAQLVAETAKLQAAAATAGLVADGTVALPANAQALRETLASMPQPGQYVLRELFGLTPAAAYRRFGTPFSVGAEGGAIYWRYFPEGSPTITLMFTDGYLSGVSRGQQ